MPRRRHSGITPSLGISCRGSPQRTSATKGPPPPPPPRLAVRIIRRLNQAQKTALSSARGRSCRLRWSGRLVRWSLRWAPPWGARSFVVGPSGGGRGGESLGERRPARRWGPRGGAPRPSLGAAAGKGPGGAAGAGGWHRSVDSHRGGLLPPHPLWFSSTSGVHVCS